jgi:UDP-N-acetylglucosamine pyrophosphorylase
LSFSNFYSKNRYRVANFSLVNKVGTIFYVPTQRVFTVKISDCVRWKAIFMRKNEKINNNNFFQYLFLVRMTLKCVCSTNDLFKNLKKIINKQNLYNAPLLKAAFTAQQYFFIFDFLKMAASEILLVFFSFLRNFAFELM